MFFDKYTLKLRVFQELLLVFFKTNVCFVFSLSFGS